MKVKVLRFRVSNWTTSALSKDKDTSDYQNGLLLVDSTETIETTINQFIKGKDVVSISVNNVDAAYHNNARGNTIDLIYTILYS